MWDVILCIQSRLFFHCELHHELQAAVARIFCTKVSAAPSLPT